MEKYKYYIFDMDGTLVDTNESIITALKATQERMKLKKLNITTLKKFLGPPLKESLMKYYGVTYDETEKITDVYRQEYLKEGIKRSKLIPGAIQLLNKLRECKCYVAVATLKQWQLAEETMKALDIASCVDYVSLNMDNSLGDKALLIQNCLSNLGCVDMKQAVMVGDSLNDAKAAKHVGIDFIAVQTGGDSNSFAEYCIDLGIVYIAKDCLELLQTITNE